MIGYIDQPNRQRQTHRFKRIEPEVQALRQQQLPESRHHRSL
jgi:hypothetical protein